MEEFDADLAYLARELRRLYCEQKAKAIRKPGYKPDKRNDGPELWKKVATLCRELGARPEDFIAAAFMYCSLSGGPFSNNLHGPSARHWYTTYLSHINAAEDPFTDAQTPSEHELRDRLCTLRNILMHRFGTCDSDKPEVMNLLRSELFGLDPLACILLSGADEQVIKRHRAGAEELLNMRPDIIRTLKEKGVPINMILP